MEEQVEREQESVRRLEARLAGLDLEQQNEQVEFLNRKIGERTFSWSLLFDRLTETMPDGVRLIQLQPAAIGGDERRRTRVRIDDDERAAPLASDRVPLAIAAEARSDEELLQFVDNLFAHPAFDNPNLLKETRNEDGTSILFSVHVTYLPRNATPGVTVEEAPEVVEEEIPARPSPTILPPASPADESEPE